MNSPHSLRTVWLLVFGLVATTIERPVPAQEPNPPAPAAAIAEKAEAYLRAQVAVNEFSGAVLVAKADEVLIAKGYGLANIEHEIPNRSRTKFRLGSITKQFTAMAILLLAEQGKLSVDDLASKHVDDCPDTWKEVTIAHLLTHTSGIPSFTSLPSYRASMPLPSSPKETLDRVRGMPLEFAPGEKFAYSNSGYVLLGQIIEQVSGKSYAEFLRASVFEPLGMKDTGYDLPQSILPQRASGYQPGPNGRTNAPYLDMTIPHAAGALYSTVEDLHRWSRALDRGALISKTAAERMFTPGKGNYGYGWFIDKQHGRPHTGHGGGINGFVTHISRYPDDQLCVIVLCNVVTSNPGAVAKDLAAIALGERYALPQERKFITVDAKVLDKYVGEYEIAPNLVLRVSRDGDRLLGQATGQGAAELRPLSEVKFLVQEASAEVTFVSNGEQKITHLILRQGGRDIEARRIK